MSTLLQCTCTSQHTTAHRHARRLRQTRSSQPDKTRYRAIERDGITQNGWKSHAQMTANTWCVYYIHMYNFVQPIEHAATQCSHSWALEHPTITLEHIRTTCMVFIKMRVFFFRNMIFTLAKFALLGPVPTAVQRTIVIIVVVVTVRCSAPRNDQAPHDESKGHGS